MSENVSPRPQSALTPQQDGGFSSLPIKGRYRVLKPLSHDGRTVLALDEDTPSQTFCVVRSRDRQRGELPLPHPVLMRWEQLGHHPHLPSLEAVFEDNDIQYLVDEYIHGKTAAEQLQLQGTWTEAQIRQLLNQILPTLRDLHDRQLLHRDIKPQNLIQQEGRWILVDLSALHCTASPKGLEAEALSGSAEYAAPEQIQGHPLPSSDLYSLGATCVHLLTGQSPFDLYDDHQGTWQWRDRTRFPITPQLTRVLNQLLHPDLNHRYSNAEAALNDLNRFDLPINWEALLVLRPLSGLLAASFVLTLLQVWGQRSPQLEYQADGMTPSLDKVIPRKDNHLPMVQTLSQGKESIWTIAVSQDGSIITGRGNGKIEIRHPHRHRPSEFSAHPQAVFSIAVSPNGQLLATTGDDNAIKIWEMPQGNLLATWDGHYDDVHHLQFSPGGDVLATAGRDGRVKIWDMTHTSNQSLRDRNSTPLRILEAHRGEVRSLAFSPNNRFLVTAGADGKVNLWDWQTGDYLQTLVSGTSEIWSVAISPDGETLATGSKDGTVELVNVRSGRRHRQNTLHRNAIVSLAFSPHRVPSSLGSEYLLLIGDVHGDMSLWYGDSGSVREIPSHQGWVSFDFTADGQSFVSGAFDNRLKVWGLQSLLE
ncbi:serine/threonine protein kinase [Phormidium yuhuli AB48]|uniref:Serine/threonine protein kinase n=1 Tax=Phormidium yuhuli AB48 TaxID=2940671 RepID=A0ABY5ATJ9_9CYAN|nr:serine/threonine-protein kinase [Phormidium yuhuli]USR92549.1 serine/threonine protein kinase [Phormidium yuhuli AB48]